MPRSKAIKSLRVLPKEAPSGDGAPEGRLDPESLLEIYGFMLQTREFEDAVRRLYQQGKIVGGAYSGRGNEATSVGTSYALEKKDYIFPMHRDLGAHLVRGQSMNELMLQYLGRAGGFARGRDGTGHYADPAKHIYGNISHLGAMVPVAVGVALASKLRREEAVVLTYIGDGGANVGEVHEGLAMASVMRLPFILVIENNQYAYSTPVAKQSIAKHLADRAIGYGIPGVTIDGTDAVEVYGAARDAVARARKGEGPSIIESVTMRMEGHAAHDTAWYVPKALLEEWKKKDPIARLEKSLAAQGLLSEEKKKTLVAGFRRMAEEAASAALEAPYPQGKEAAEDVYASS
jgi:TPP-dependent pyruvate/acetoin dehydrogenase alpha subunit